MQKRKPNKSNKGHKPAATKRIALQKAAMIEAMKKNLGIVSASCDKVGISRQTHYDWKKNDPKYSQEIDNISEAALDFAEGKLLQNINSGDTIATIFFLKTKGKSRGYVEKTEVDNTLKVAPIIIDWGKEGEA